MPSSDSLLFASCPIPWRSPASLESRFQPAQLPSRHNFSLCGGLLVSSLPHKKGHRLSQMEISRNHPLSPEISPKFPFFEGWSWVPKRLRLAPCLPTSWFCRIRGPSHEAPGVGLPVADVLAHAVELASGRKTKTDC